MFEEIHLTEDRIQRSDGFENFQLQFLLLNYPTIVHPDFDRDAYLRKHDVSEELINSLFMPQDLESNLHNLHSRLDYAQNIMRLKNPEKMRKYVIWGLKMIQTNMDYDGTLINNAGPALGLIIACIPYGLLKKTETKP